MSLEGFFYLNDNLQTKYMTLSHLEANLEDAKELKTRINDFFIGKENEDRFKHFRLTRGVYGQRQFGVQMFRLKVPYGKITTDQLTGAADIAEQYGSANLHLTTRQNIQFHYVKLADAPAVWEALAHVGLTAREACGNTVRNITGSVTAGIDKDELFDISPYVEATFNYFLRNPICQEMGRKIKPAFSNTDSDTAYTYFADFGFVPRIVDGQKGFKLVVGGGLGAQAIEAFTVTEFIAADRILPFMEASLRVFDRYGEREKRHKARLKFLIKSLGAEEFLRLVHEEIIALPNQKVAIDDTVIPPAIPNEIYTGIEVPNKISYTNWLTSNTFTQKQEAYKAVYVRVPNGDISSETGRKLAAIIQKYAADDIRITIDQNLLLRYILPANLPALYTELDQLGLAKEGAGSIADVTACPGTDTCNLGVTNSTTISEVIAAMIEEKYPELLLAKDIDIKISGCMNSCGQHMACGIGLHGSSIKRGDYVIPAMQVVIGGGIDKAGFGHIGDKVIKLPTKRIPTAISLIIEDYLANKTESDYFIFYAKNKDKKHYYDLLKPLANVDDITQEDLVDWGEDAKYVQEIGVGECAGVMVDMVSTILLEGKEKLNLAQVAFDTEAYTDAVYQAYNAYVIGAKAMLLSDDVACNTQIKILEDFDTHFVSKGTISIPGGNFQEHVLTMKNTATDRNFASSYIAEAQYFFEQIAKVKSASNDLNKTVVESYYKA